MPKPFKSIKSLTPGRSVFDLSYSKLFTCDMGELIPVMHDEVVPGDRFKISSEVVVRMQPLVSPVLHPIYCRVEYFFVPYRLVWEDWETFISGGVDGDDATPMVYWDPLGEPVAYDKYSLWDYFGFPLERPVGTFPIDLPRRAYCKIWNDYYRDETLQTELDITDQENNVILLRNWTKDYFTSALETQQRGTAPALPLSGIGNISWPSASIITTGLPPQGESLQVDYNTASNFYLYTDTGHTTAKANYLGWLALGEIDFADAATFNVADLRLAFQIQKWMERNNRSGVRYTEFLRSHFGVAPRDDRLQRPEFIGSTKGPVVVSEVLQTSETNTTPQGTMAGHGIAVNTSYCGDYFATEYGCIIGILSIMPVPMYCQGINRQWRKDSRYDFYFPEFANLSEQAIELAEIYVTDDPAKNAGIFGYQGRFDEMRTKQNLICGDMRDDFDFWHLARIFAAEPALNEDFIQCIPDKRIFAVPAERGFIVHAANRITAIRPIPAISEPGLLDHN